MPRAAIVDTGPLVAFLDRGERHHDWAVERIAELHPPLLVCEPVLAEAMYLVRGQAAAQDAIYGLLGNGALRVGLHVEDHLTALRALHRKYRDVPISLADACIVRLAESHDDHAVLTLDSDFTVYRKHGRQALDLIRP